MRHFSVAALSLVLLTGCAARRVLRISSDPPGATVSLDGVTLEGVTPLEYRFEHYGVRRITMRKSGFQTCSGRIEMNPPWYSRFPFDIVSEVLLPFGWRDTHRFGQQLVVGEDLAGTPTLRSVVERANLLRLAGPEGPRELPSSTTSTGLPADPAPTSTGGADDEGDSGEPSDRP